MSLFSRLLRYMRPYAVQMAVAALLLAAAGMIMAAVVATFKPLVNEVLLLSSAAPEPSAAEALELLRRLGVWEHVQSASAWVRLRPLVRVPALFIAIIFVRGLALFFGQYLAAKTGASVIRDLRAELYDSLLAQSLTFFRLHPTGLILSRVLSDVQRVQVVSTAVLADLIRVGAMVPALLIVILIHDWRMSIFALVVFPFIAYPTARLGRRLRKASTRSQETTAETANLLKETVTGIKIVQAFTMEARGVERFREAVDRILRADIQAGKAAALSEPIMEQVAALAAAGLFYYAGASIAHGTLDAGGFVVVIAGLTLLLMSLRRLNRVNIQVQQALAAVKRIFEVVDWAPEITEVEDARPLPPLSDELRFEGVSFSYTGREKALDAVDLVIRRGEVVALVGPSGAGKTTLANLVLRFYDPTEGVISVDGHDIRQATLTSLRGMIGLVTQETILFDDTVRDNITCGRPDVPLERVKEVARAAHADEFVEKLPDGYETRLGEGGSTLSMGQRQRLAIARALLKDPPIMILDEATSALDSQSEDLVQKALANLLAGRSSLVIAHRLSTVRRADRIVVLDRGRIVEQGSHEELLASGGLYSTLYDLQFNTGG